MPRQKFKVQTAIAVHGNKQAGAQIGRVWQTVAKGKRQTTAEHIARFARIDARHERPQFTRTAQVRITQ